MYDRPYDLGRPEDGYPVRIQARGNEVLATPMINRGTAFTLEERAALGLTGLLPGGVSTIETLLANSHR
jgi:malate dehydrogenase (oxaloacetate-decarboxylating)